MNCYLDEEESEVVVVVLEEVRLGFSAIFELAIFVPAKDILSIGLPSSLLPPEVNNFKAEH